MENRDQQEFWTDIAGPKWVAHQAAMDAIFQPVLDAVFDQARLAPGEAVLDIGCGTGASVLQAADKVGDTGQVLGADISASLLALARERSTGRANIAFLEADAGTHPFEPGQFDHLISRFGVMFFADPTAAFANMARALKPGARITMACWGPIPGNPFFTLAAQAARDVLGPVPKSDPDGPGPFAFRDPARVLGLLGDAGLAEATCDTATIPLTPEGDVAALVDALVAIGPIDAAISHHSPTGAQIAQVREHAITLFSQFDTEDGLHIPSEINIFSARVPG